MIGKRFALVRWRVPEPPRRVSGGCRQSAKGRTQHGITHTDWRTSQDCHVAQACCALSATGVIGAIRAGQTPVSFLSQARVFAPYPGRKTQGRRTLCGVRATGKTSQIDAAGAYCRFIASVGLFPA
jgi:hypothetical protein